MTPVATFIQKVIETYSSGHAREHSYRPALKELFEQTTGLNVINEPKRSEHGAPDFVFLKGKTVIAYAEAKDINVSLDEIEKSEQMTRYYGYSNIILTNGLDFRFFRNGIRYSDPIIVGKLHKDSVEPFEGPFQLLADTIGDFIKESKEPIKSGTVLSKVMAGKARRIRDNVKKFLEDEKNPKNENLLGVYEVIKKLLLADLDHAKFADMYAQTIVYGLFVARYYDKTTDNFSRQEARDLVPASNPFLRHFFDHIAGSSFDPRIEYIVNELCEEFNHADVQAIVHNYYKVDKDSSRDPIIHFYEDFLQEYDSVERKKMGVFYTPLPVVRFIVRTVDDILKKEFDLPQGLADASKIDILKEIQGKRHKVPIHRVQILDPATGTGTFLNEVILHIKKSFEGQEGRWSSYVNADLLLRMHGFELMMASYTIAHLKLSSTIAETGAKIENTRLGVYLTNSLEKAEIEEKTLFDIGLGKAITEESNQANKVKNELPIMVVMGNPPYSVSSQNKGEWIQDLIKEYKKDLNEKNIQQLSDDYIKFIRLSESLIEKNGSGIVAMITNNSFIDGVTHRQMRKHLLETFDSIYIVNLHGNSKKKEKAPDGGRDENVFNIMQGVSIDIFVKNEGKKKGLGEVYHKDLYGKREDKFESLNKGSLENFKWNFLKCVHPNYFFTPKDFSGEGNYNKGFSVSNLFPIHSSGATSAKDDLLIKFSTREINELRESFQTKTDEEITQRNNVEKKQVTAVRNDIKNIVADSSEILYRPFDVRHTLYSLKSEGVFSRPRSEVMRHMLKDNLGFIAKRGFVQEESAPCFITKYIIDRRSWSRPGMLGAEQIYPLYLYAEDGSKVPNLNKEIIEEIEKTVGKIIPEDILDYIYAVLHSPSYREKYKEFLKIDFPRVPYPKDVASFKALVILGRELREFHLLESPKLKNLLTTFPEAGSDTVEAKYPKYKDGKVYINEKQYFGGVPKIAWNFYIGGYQPAQKWLKDRRDRLLSSEDLEHYQKMIVALVETEKTMKEIDNIL
ncbi:MAG: N-6 DNA methylase [Candidatus Taylorbacteria bacterium]|nr:N-6 DNA methylase [Candidatus Taylorbacteria bacterium]